MMILTLKLPKRLIDKIFFFLIPLIGLTLMTQLFSPVFAQARGGDAEEFFNEGDQEMEQETQNLENESPQQGRQQEEEKLEQELNIEQNNPRAPKVQEVPSSPVGDGDNVSTPPPEGEVQIKFP